jgi:cell division protein ZapA (FtsZ GTPase activity inhibitor)
MNPPGDHLVELEILGQTYQVRVQGSYEWAQKVGRMVDETMGRIQRETRLNDVTKIAILAALNLSDRLLAAQAAHSEEAEAVRQASAVLADALDDALR